MQFSCLFQRLSFDFQSVNYPLMWKEDPKALEYAIVLNDD